MTRWGLVTLAAAIMLAAGCSKKEAEAPPAQAPEVAVLTVKAQTVPVSFEFVGQTESSQQVEIRARVNGFLEKRVYTEGAFVKPGQVLFTMDTKPFDADLRAAKAELAQQQARLTTARANLARVKPLVADNALAAKDLDDATGQEQAATAAVEAANAKVTDANINLGYATITSPLAGLSSFAKVQDGAYVSAANSLLTYVARLDPMRVNFSLSENETLRKQDEVARGLLKPADRDEYLVELVLADGSVFPARGRITFADAAFSQDTGTFLLRAELPNPDGQLRPGQFVRVNVIGFKRPNAIVVPQRAVQEGPRGAFVWTVDAQGKAAQSPVEAGDWMGDQWLVSTGLKDGARVIVDGFMRLAPGMPVRVKDVPAEPLPAEAVAHAGAPASTASRTRSGSSAGAGAGAGAGSSAGMPTAGLASLAGGVPEKDSVFFDQSRTRLDATARVRLQTLALAMKSQPAIKVTLNGYVDATGDAQRNKDLARQRAQAVRDALVEAGVSAERIALQAPANITGGESPALARRVDIVTAGAR